MVNSCKCFSFVTEPKPLCYQLIARVAAGHARYLDLQARANENLFKWKQAKFLLALISEKMSVCCLRGVTSDCIVTFTVRTPLYDVRGVRLHYGRYLEK